MNTLTIEAFDIGSKKKNDSPARLAAASSVAFANALIEALEKE